MSTLGDIREPSTYPAIVKNFFGKNPDSAYGAIRKIGIGAEFALLAELNNSALYDSEMRSPFFSLLRKIGGDESIRVLENNIAKSDHLELKRKMSETVRLIKKKPSYARLGQIRNFKGLPIRDWSARNGKEQHKGQLSSVFERTATITCANGDIVELPIKGLGENDREYIEKELQAAVAIDSPLAD